MAQRIEGVEIFATGRHRGSEVVDITTDDLAQMVNSFNTLSDKVEGFRPVLKLGHTETQEFFGQRKGAPNLGFVEKIWVEGTKVLANFANVPDALVDLIKKRRFNAVSIEMFPKTEFNGQEFKNVLTAVALLGAELPAVKGLKELAATLFTEEPDGPEFPGDKIELKEEDMPVTYTQEQHDALVEKAVSEAVAATKAEFEDERNTLVTERDEAVQGKETAQTALREFEDATRKKDAEAMVDKAIEAGKLAPAQKDTALAFALNVTGTIKFDDEEKSASKLFEEFLEAMPKKVDLSEDGEGEGEKKTFDTPGDEVDARARAKMAKDKDLDYAAARTLVLSEDEGLKTRYFHQED